MTPNDEKHCVLGATNAAKIESLRECVMSIKEDVKLLTNHYSRRLPTWATALIAAMTTAIGVLTTLLVAR